MKVNLEGSTHGFAKLSTAEANEKPDLSERGLDESILRMQSISNLKDYGRY